MRRISTTGFPVVFFCRMVIWKKLQIPIDNGVGEVYNTLRFAEAN